MPSFFLVMKEKIHYFGIVTTGRGYSREKKVSEACCHNKYFHACQFALRIFSTTETMTKSQTPKLVRKALVDSNRWWEVIVNPFFALF